jgi:hypothetical protein
MKSLPSFHQSNRTNAERVRRALRCFQFSKNALLVVDVIVERTVAATPERWTTTFTGHQEIMDETSLSKSRVSEAIRELELTRVIVRNRSGKGEFTVTLNPPIDTADGHVVWSAPRASVRYINDETLARAIEGQPLGDIAGVVAGAPEMSPVRALVDKEGRGETGQSDHGAVPPVGTLGVPVSGKELPERPVSGKPVSGIPVLSGMRKLVDGVPMGGTASEDEILDFAKRMLPSEFMAEHGGLVREFCRECRPALYEAICAYLAVRVKPHDLRGWLPSVYREKRDTLRRRQATPARTKGDEQ